MLLIIFVWGIILSLYNFEVLTGFLFVLELTAVFIIILFLLALNFEGKQNKSGSIFLYTWFLILLNFLFYLYIYTKPFINKQLNSFSYYDDYYSSIWNKINNDLAGLYICYYQINIPLFVIFAFFIFFATLACVQLSNISKIKVQIALTSLKFVFNFFTDLLSFDFKRRQNNIFQQRRYAYTRFVNFNKTNVTEE